MSGPPVMVEAGRAAFEARGLTLDHMFSDAFAYAADSKEKKDAAGLLWEHQFGHKST
jgi:CDP-4-dehydro-6-deoxyglucose reductase